MQIGGEKMSKKFLEMKNISIEFPGVKALDNAKFEAETGEIQALIGANGAGKSTLMKVLAGAYTNWTGEIYIDGKETKIRSISDSKELGIEIVYQEVDMALVPYLTVGENIMLDVLVLDMDKKHFVNWNKIYSSAKNILTKLNVRLDVHKKVSDLSLAEKQMVLIAKAISRECKFLILDEPTAPLSNSETKELFRIVNELKKNNVGIIFISHRLPEIFQICEAVTILKDGKYVTKKLIKDTNQNQIVELMLGRNFDENYPKSEAEIGDIVLQVEKLTDSKMLKNIKFNLKKGEIIGIAGLVGAGKTELCKAMFGASSNVTGEIKMNNKSLVIKNPSDAIKNRFAFIPEERRKEGVLVNEPVYSNISLPTLSNFEKGLFMQFKKEKKAARQIIKNLGIKTPNENQKVAYLSGGNQQKVAVGKWLIADADVYILDEPTKGIDVGAKKDVFELIGSLAKSGKSIIYASCELQEILGITDRVYVMYNGEIVKELVTSDTKEEEILFYSAGGKN